MSQDWIEIGPNSPFPAHGQLVEIAWFADGQLEHGPKFSRLVGAWEWQDGWTPTHWRPFREDEDE